MPTLRRVCAFFLVLAAAFVASVACAVFVPLLLLPLYKEGAMAPAYSTYMVTVPSLLMGGVVCAVARSRHPYVVYIVASALLAGVSSTAVCAHFMHVPLRNAAQVALLVLLLAGAVASVAWRRRAALKDALRKDAKAYEASRERMGS